MTQYTVMASNPKMQMSLGNQNSYNREYKPHKTQESSLSTLSLLVGRHSEGLRLQQKGGNQSNKDE